MYCICGAFELRVTWIPTQLEYESYASWGLVLLSLGFLFVFSHFCSSSSGLFSLSLSLSGRLVLKPTWSPASAFSEYYLAVVEVSRRLHVYLHVQACEGHCLLPHCQNSLVKLFPVVKI